MFTNLDAAVLETFHKVFRCEAVRSALYAAGPVGGHAARPTATRVVARRVLHRHAGLKGLPCLERRLYDILTSLVERNLRWTCDAVAATAFGGTIDAAHVMDLTVERPCARLRLMMRAA